jgi:hypothetical protein
MNIDPKLIKKRLEAYKTMSFIFLVLSLIIGILGLIWTIPIIAKLSISLTVISGGVLVITSSIEVS